MARKQTLKAASVTIIVLSLAMFVFFYIQVSSPQALLVGVAKGDVFYYSMYATYHSSDPAAKIQVPAFEANNTDWVRIEVTGVNGSVVSHVYTLHFKNESEQAVDGQTDVSVNAWTGGTSVFRGVPICPGNLQVGDFIPSIPLAVNETREEATLLGVRQVNRVVWSTPLETGECLFDRRSGMLLDLTRSHTFIDNATGNAVTKTDLVAMTSANLASSQLPIGTFSVLALAASMFAVGAALMIYALRRKT